MHFLTNWMDQYGYWVLFFGLMAELVAFGIPTEVLMSYAGLLVFQGRLNWFISILTAGMGSIVGMTVSYWIGYKLGTPFFVKYGSRMHMGPERIKKTSEWFERYGNKLLLIAYFIPGIRHVAGYFSGITRIPYRTYAIYAYTGAFIWVGTFISLGKVLGPKWEQYHKTITKYLLYAGIILAILLILLYFYRKYKRQLFEFILGILRQGEKTFRTMGRVKFLIVIAFAVFISFFAVMVGLIQDFLEQEFTDFDAVASFIVHVVFDETWAVWMGNFASLVSLWVLVPLIVSTFGWIVWKNKDRFLEARFFVLVLLGGELWNEGLRHLFHRTGPTNIPHSFPSEQTLIVIIFWGFAAFLAVRHLKAIWIHYAAFLAVIAIALLVGLSSVYFNLQYPSDVVAGYVFGGVWLSMNIVLLEIFRVLRQGE